MGILDSLEQAAGMGGGTSQAVSSPVAAVLQMLQSQPGGVAGVLQKFQAAGLGGLVSSWVGAGSNQPVSTDQVQSAIGSGPISQIAEKLGLSHDQAAGHVAQLLPMIVDHLSPNGQAPGSGLAQLEGLLAQFAQR